MEPLFVSSAPSGLKPQRRAHYERLGTVDLETVLRAIESPHPVAIIMGQEVKVKGLRLRTFKNNAPCCSDPDCSLTFSHFAVERSLGKGGAPAPDDHPYHLNLYGINQHGHEVLFTHDHTLARSLGGADTDSNTTPMCLPCNSRKSVKEHALVKQRRKALGIPINLKVPQPSTPEAQEERRAKAQGRFDQMAALRGMTPEAYKAHCEEQGAAFSKLNPFNGREPPYMALATQMGMSISAFRFFRHDHNEYQIALRKPAEEPAVSRKMKP